MQYRTAFHFIFNLFGFTFVRWCCLFFGFALCHRLCLHWPATLSPFILLRIRKWSSLRIHSFRCRKRRLDSRSWVSKRKYKCTICVCVCKCMRMRTRKGIAHRDRDAGTHTHPPHNQLCATRNNINNNYWKVHDIGLNCGFSLYGVGHTYKCVRVCAMMCCG